MSELNLYTTAVSSRKMIRRTKSQATLNYAVCSQIEEDDVPRLLEIIRLYDQAVEHCIGPVGHEEDIKESELVWYRDLLIARNKVEAVAAEGSKKEWGRDNGQ